jgi:ankyrin repeat protein
LIDAAAGSESGGDYPGVVAVLVAAGADVNAKTDLGWTPLASCVINGGSPALVPLLIKAGVDVNAVGVGNKTALSWAAFNGDIPMMQALIAAGANIYGSGGAADGPLFSAVQADRLAAVRLLISGGVDPNRASRFGSPLSVAANLGHLDVVQALLDPGADVNGNEQETPLKIALEAGHSDVAALLKQRGGHN